jgi:hypothetical protein
VTADGVDHAGVGPGRHGGQRGELAPDDVRGGRIAHEERSILTQQRDMTPGTGIDRLVEPVQVLEIDGGHHDACKMSRIVVEPARQDHGVAAFRTRGEQFAHEKTRVRIVALSAKIDAIRGVVVRDGESPRTKQLVALRVHDRDLADLRRIVLSIHLPRRGLPACLPESCPGALRQQA